MTVGRLTTTYLLVGRRLATRGTWTAGAAAFAVQRAQAEAAAKQRSGATHDSLSAVYAEMAASPFLLDAGAAMEEERAVQLALKTPAASDSPPLERNRYESLLARRAMETGGVSSLLADASRAVRAGAETSEPERARARVAAGVAAPVLIGFVAWTLEAARSAGCDRVGYVSRDGQILHAIAERLEAQRPAEARLRIVYTHGGRRVWHPPGLTREVLEGPPPEWWVGEGMPAGQPASPLDMLALRDDEVPASMVAAIDQIWRCPPTERPDRLADLWRQPEVRAALEQIAIERRRLLIGYLEGGDLGTGRWAMVDVGWRGRSGVSLNRVLRAEGLTTPLHLYFGMLKPEPELTRSGDWASYLFCRPGPDRRAGDMGGGLPSFVEIVCSADHGPVRSFREGPSGIEPVMDPVDGRAVDRGVPALQSTILAVTDRVAPFAADIGLADLRPVLIDLLELFLHEPDRAEVAAWGDFPFSADPAGQEAMPWVSRWSTRDALEWAFRGKRPHSFWPEASRSLLPASARVLIRAREQVAARVR